MLLHNCIFDAMVYAMKQRYTLHTHSLGFDGKSTVQQMIDTARDMGFYTIGISNHFIVHPNIKQAPMYQYSVRGGYSNIYASGFDEVMGRFVPHYDELEILREQNPDIKILRGLEVDFFDDLNWQKNFEKCIAILRPDYTIGSCHFILHNGVLLNSHDWAKADCDTRDILLKQYWNNIAIAATSGLFTWMAHLDLPKKVGLGREYKWQGYEDKAVSAIAKSGVGTEINTSGYKTGCDEPYPSIRILKMLASANVPVVISDDAHAASQIGRHFARAENLIHDLGLRRFDITH